MTSSRPMKGNIVEVYIKPNSRNTGIEGCYNGRIKIKIASTPEKGRANKELIGLISNKTGIPKSKVRIISGITSNYKTIILGVDNKTDYMEVLLRNSMK